MKYIEVDGVEGLVEVPDDITDEQILDVGEKLTQGRVQSAAGAMMREGGSMWGKAAQGVARGGQVLRESPIMWTPGRGVYVDKAQKERLSEVTGKEKQKELESDPLYQFGENLAAGAQEAFPTNPLYADKLETAVASGLGSVMALAPSALAGPAAPLVAGGGYGMSAGESGAEDAQAILDSRIQAALEQGDINTAAQLEQDKFSIETAAFLLNAPIGAATEGILGVAGRWAGMARGKGGVLGGLTDKLVGSMAKSQKVKRGAEGFVSESLQEGLEQGAGNEVAKVLYDPDRKLTQGVGMSMLAGGVVGTGVGAGAGSLADRNARTKPVTHQVAPTAPETALAPESANEVQAMLDALAKANEVTKDNFTDEEAISQPMEAPVDITPPPPPVDEQADPQAELDAQVNAGTTEAPPTPESPEQVEAQLESTLDPDSTKAVTLVTPGEELPPIPEGLEVGEPTEAGTPVFNPEKITPKLVTEAGQGEVYDPEVLGLGAEVAQSDTTVTTSTPDGTPVLDELVTPDTVDAAIEAQQDAVPGGITEIKPAAEVVADRKRPENKRPTLLGEGDVVLSTTGRELTPFPRVDATTDRKTTSTIKRVDAWLRENAIAEARARNDRFNLRQFEAENPNSIPPASKDAMSEYLFGEQNFTGKPIRNDASKKKPSSAKPEAPTQGQTTPTPPGSAPSPDAGKQGVGVQSSQPSIKPELGAGAASPQVTTGPEINAPAGNTVPIKGGEITNEKEKGKLQGKAQVSLTPERLAAIKEERAKIVAEMRALMGGVGAGVDPKYVALTARLVGTYVEEGVLRFADFARQFKNDFPEAWADAKSYLRGAWNIVSDQDDRIKEVSKAEAAGDIAAAEEPEPQLDPKQKQEEQEAEIVVKAKAIAQGPGTNAEKYAKLVAMYKAQPRLGIRTTDSKLAQAYSTPPPLAFIAGILADLKNGTKIAESTVGNGMLLITAPDNAGISANEMDPKRAARFERIFGIKPTQMDAASKAYFDILSEFEPDRVVLNPPFGARLAETGNETFPLHWSAVGNPTTKSLDLAIALNALETMGEDGKAVIILGAKTGSMAANINQKTRVEGYRRREYLDLFKRFNVVDMYTLNGDMYDKMGAGWPVDIFVIDGKRETKSSKDGGIVRPWIEAPRVYNDWESLGELINENEQQRSSPGTSGGNSGGGDSGDARGPRKPSDVPSQPGQRGGGVPGGGPGQTEKAGPGDRTVEPDTKHEPGTDPKLGEQKAEGSKETTGVDDGDGGNTSTALTEPYVSNSGAKPSGLVVPANIASDQRAALEDLEREEGKSVDEYLSEKLGMTIDELHGSFSGPQIDATSLAIRNIERGSALINSDQTGTGKGRTVAALIRYAMKRGLTPIFVTAKHTLYTDMAGRDLPAIGVKDFTPLVTNRKVDWKSPDGKQIKQNLSAQESSDILGEVARTGKLPSGTHAFFTTIDQLNGDDAPGFREDAKAKARRKRDRNPRPLGPILKAIKALSPNAILILDESHLAAGESSNINHQLVEDTGGGSIIGSAKGVYYSSATFAKRPDNIALYAAGTSIRRSGLELKALVDMLKSGKLPLQQALTSMLSRMGEFVRRQQDWGNVKIEFKKATNDAEREVRMADTYTEFLLSLERFSKLVRKAADVLEDDENQIRAEEAAVDVESTSFASRLFNLSSQYLTALRADAVASEAISALKNGEKPVISFFNTMEGPISDLQEMGLLINFNGMLRRELENLLTVTVKDPTKPPGEQNTKVKLARGQLTEKGQAEYDRIVHDIDNTDLGDMPISPMDTIQRRIKDAGFTVGEVTARSISLELDEQGNQVAKSRKKGSRNDIISDFNHDRVNALVMNGSASTGVSMHTAPNFSPKGRVLIVAQPNPDINEFIQVLGRVMRFGQVKLPRYVVLSSSLAAEQRFMVMLRRKMASLNANTSADTDSEMTGNKGFAEDIFNEVGDGVVGRVVMSPGNLEWALAVDIPLMDPDEDSAGDGAYASKATGRFVLLPNDVAKRMWDQVTEMYQDTISALDESGENPLKAQVEDLKAKTVEVTPFVAGDGKTPFDGPAKLEKVTVKPTKSAPAYQDAIESARNNEASVRTRIRDWISKSREMESERLKVAESRELTDAQLDNIRKAFEDTRNDVASMADLIGTAYEITDNGYVAIPTDLQLRDKEMSDFTSPSAHYLIVTRNMVNSKARYALSQVNERLKTDDPIDRSEDKWNESLESATERYVVTGNLLRGYSQAMQASRGMTKPRIAIYTTSDGDKKTGVLMASNWSPDAVQEVVRTPINDLTHFIQALGLGTAIVADGLSIKNDVIRVNASNRFKPIWSGWPFAGAQQKGSEFEVRFAPSSATQIYEFLTSKGVQLRTDRVEDALNKAIKATDPRGGNVFEFFTGVSYAVANVALKAAKAVYLVTRDVVKAVNAAIEKLREEVPGGFDENEARVRFQDAIESGTESFFAPASGQKVQESKGRFTGLVSKDSDKQWQQQAEEWLDGFGNNLQDAYEKSISTVSPIDASLRQYVLTELISRTDWAIDALKNSPSSVFKMMPLLKLQSEIANSLKDSGKHEFGSVGAARALAFKRIEWMMPMLLLRKLVRDAQKRLPFPDITSDKVREWLKRAGSRAVSEVKKAMKDADNVVAKELRREVKSLGVNWGDIIRSSEAVQGDFRRAMYRNVMAHPKLAGLNPRAVTEIVNLLANEWERQRLRIFRQEFAKEVKLPNVSARTMNRLQDAIPAIVIQANVGLLDNEAFRNAVAPKFGVEQFDSKTADLVKKLAQEAQGMNGVNRTKLLNRITDTIQRAGGVAKSDVFRDYWFAAMLSGVRTMVDNGLSILNGGLTTALAAARNPGAAGLMTRAYLSGLSEAGSDFVPILKGERWRTHNVDIDRPASALDAMLASPNPFKKALGTMAFVSRLISALDHLNALSTRQAMIAWAAMRSDPATAEAMVSVTPEQRAEAREQAIQEGTEKGLLNKRIREILEERVPVEMVLTATQIGLIASFQNDPYGVAGHFYSFIKRLDKMPGFGKFTRLVSGVAFARYALNYTNDILNYVSPIGIIRWYASSPGMQEKEHGLKITEEERQLIMMKSILGSLVAAVAAAVFLGDDDDDEKERAIDITGSFKSLDPSKRNQLLSEKRQPYSIRFGDTYVSYRQLPIAGILGTVGEMRDKQLFAPDSWKAQNPTSTVANAAIAGMFIVRDSSALTGLMDLLGFASAYKYDTEAMVDKSIPRFVARLLGGMIPNIAKEIDAWQDPAIYKATAGWEYFMQQVPWGRRSLEPGPQVNVLGEKIAVERLPWSRWVKERSKAPEWDTIGKLADKGIFMPVPGEFSVQTDDGTRRKPTKKEMYDYQKAVGEAYKDFIKDDGRDLLDMEPADARRVIDRTTTRLRKQARMELGI